jgi:Skp family chaperone for outer membrane proteins
MRRISLFVALVTGAMLSAGCGMQTGQPQASSSGGLAVLDLDVIAKSTGRTAQIEETLTTQQNGLKLQLQKVQVDFSKQLEDKRKEFGDAPTEEQEKELAGMNRNAINQFAQYNRQAETALARSKAKLIAELRAEIRPVAQEVAASKGLSIVIPKNEGFLLSVDPGVDITADVLRAYQTRKPAPTAAIAAPQQQPVKPPTKPATNTAAAPLPTERE